MPLPSPARTWSRSFFRRLSKHARTLRRTPLGAGTTVTLDTGTGNDSNIANNSDIESIVTPGIG